MLITLPHNLGLSIKAKRKALNLSQADLATRTGLKQQTISAFENNPTHAKIDTLFRILSALALDLSLTNKNKSEQSGWPEEW